MKEDAYFIKIGITELIFSGAQTLGFSHNQLLAAQPSEPT